MIWIGLLVVAIVAMLPLGLALRGGAMARGRRDAALALHRAQLHELDRDLAEGRIAATEHAQARLEVQRRLLAAAEAVEATPTRASRTPLLLVLGLVPLCAFILYLVGGSPLMPAEPLAGRIASARAEMAQADALLTQLRGRLATLDPHSDQARVGYTLLGNVESSRGDWAAAAAAWRVALADRFDPTLAAETAEAATRAEGSVSPASADLFRKALAAAPADAPWRSLAEQRLAQANGG
jgi:cytochrome c-type biogenesis protein CcmH